MTRRGIPIREYPLVETASSGISFGQKYEEFEAASAANIPLDRWINNEVSIEAKTEILAWYRLRVLIQVHAEESRRAAQRAQQRSKNSTGRKA